MPKRKSKPAFVIEGREIYDSHSEDSCEGGMTCPECKNHEMHVWQKYCNTDHMAAECPDCGLYLDDESETDEE